MFLVMKPAQYDDHSTEDVCIVTKYINFPFLAVLLQF